MFTDRKPTGLKIVVFLAFINSIAIVTHFILLDRGVWKSSGLVQDFLIFAVTVAAVAVLPVIFGAYGLYIKRMWGLGFFTLGSGATLSAAVFILLTSIKALNFGIMFFASIYMIVYVLLATIYSWALRHHFRDI